MRRNELSIYASCLVSSVNEVANIGSWNGGVDVIAHRFNGEKVTERRISMRWMR